MKSLLMSFFAVLVLVGSASAGWNDNMRSEPLRFMPGLNMASGDVEGALSAITPPVYRIKLGEASSIGLGVFDIGISDNDETLLHGGVGACLNFYLTVCASGVRDFRQNHWQGNYTVDLAAVWRQYSPFK